MSSLCKYAISNEWFRQEYQYDMRTMARIPFMRSRACRIHMLYTHHTCVPPLFASINSIVIITYRFPSISDPLQLMGKFRKPSPAAKTQIFEATTWHTRRGPKIVNVPVESPQTPASRNSSPSKKRAWSPGELQDDGDDSLPSFQDPKQSWCTGKVGVYLTTILSVFNIFQQMQNAFLEEYLQKRHGLLIELLRHEAPPSNCTCTMCNSTPGIYWCKDCFGPHLLCAVCCVSAHLTSPFHHIQKFNGEYFEHSDLDDLGLVLDLQQHTHDCFTRYHHSDEGQGSKPNLSDSDDDFTDVPPHSSQPSDERIPIRSNLIIVASTGIFKHLVLWCQCANITKPYVQLLHAKLFPVSFKRPSTAFTFEVLDHFQINALECKTAAMKFMSKIVRISNEAFPSLVPVGILNFPALSSLKEMYRTTIVSFCIYPDSGEIFTIGYGQG